MKTTNDTKHTPGPWIIQLIDSPNGGNLGAVSINQSNGNDRGLTLAHAFTDIPAGEANARLIAAAPCLLESLKETLLLLRDLGRDADCHAHFVKARAIICQAEGQA